MGLKRRKKNEREREREREREENTRQGDKTYILIKPPIKNALLPRQ